MNFRIGFDFDSQKEVFENWGKIFASHQWSEGYFTDKFEELWSEYCQVKALSFCNFSGAALALLEYINVKDQVVLCPSNTFMATIFCSQKAGAKVTFVDCSREDFCIDYDDLTKKIKKYKPKALWLVHIGGHLSFKTKEIVQLCHENDVIILEDCSHAHGATLLGQKAGSFGYAGVYSFGATKTISTAEGGMLVSNDTSLQEFAKSFRNYGKPGYEVEGLNYRMNEFMASLGCVQVQNLEKIVNWKNNYARDYLDDNFPRRILLPENMRSGLYKYIVFDEIPNSTGKVYADPCHRLLKLADKLPNTDWVSKNHWCVPIYYEGNKKK